MNRQIRFRLLLIAVPVLLLTTSFFSLRTVEADGGSRVIFEMTNEPGRWIKNTAGPIAGTQSLAVANPGVEIVFTGSKWRPL